MSWTSFCDQLNDASVQIQALRLDPPHSNLSLLGIKPSSSLRLSSPPSPPPPVIIRDADASESRLMAPGVQSMLRSLISSTNNNSSGRFELQQQQQQQQQQQPKTNLQFHEFEQIYENTVDLCELCQDPSMIARLGVVADRYQQVYESMSDLREDMKRVTVELAQEEKHPQHAEIELYKQLNSSTNNHKYQQRGNDMDLDDENDKDDNDNEGDDQVEREIMEAKQRIAKMNTEIAKLSKQQQQQQQQQPLIKSESNRWDDEIEMLKRQIEEAKSAKQKTAESSDAFKRRRYSPDATGLNNNNNINNTNGNGRLLALLQDANIALDAAIANSSNSLTQASAVDSVRTAEVVENLLTVLQPPVENIHTSQIAVEVASSAAYKIVTAICDLAASNLLMNRGPNTPARSNRYGAATPSKSRKSRAMAIALDNAHENPEAVVASFALKRLMDARRQSNGSMATTTTTATTTMIADGAIPLQKLKEMCRAFVEENGYTPDLAISVVYLLDTHKLIRIDRSTKQHLVYSTI